MTLLRKSSRKVRGSFFRKPQPKKVTEAHPASLNLLHYPAVHTYYTSYATVTSLNPLRFHLLFSLVLKPFLNKRYLIVV